MTAAFTRKIHGHFGLLTRKQSDVKKMLIDANQNMRLHKTVKLLIETSSFY